MQLQRLRCVASACLGDYEAALGEVTLQLLAQHVEQAVVYAAVLNMRTWWSFLLVQALWQLANDCSAAIRMAMPSLRQQYARVAWVCTSAAKVLTRQQHLTGRIQQQNYFHTAEQQC
jgi:hypothetical protein